MGVSERGQKGAAVRVFLDTEFSGLGQRSPCLISIGLITEDGQHTFYAELPPESYLEKCDSWVREHVLPPLDGGTSVMQPDDLHKGLETWFASLGEAQIAIDSEGYDFKFLRAILDPWPAAIHKEPFILWLNDEQGEAFSQAVEEAYISGLRWHHALDDAKANRLGWVAAAAFSER